MTDRVDNFNPVQLTQQLRDAGFNAELVNPAKKLNIGTALNTAAHRIDTSKTNLVSQEKFTYDNMQGVLIKYDDGTVEFVTTKNNNGNKIKYCLRFKNEKDVQKKQPSSEIYNFGEKNQVTANYEYHRNGKVKKKETFNAENKLIRKELYDKEGLLENRKIFDNNGELINDIRVKQRDKKNHTAVVECYDKDNKLKQTAYNQYQADNKTLVSQEVKYPSGAIKSKTDCYDSGKIHNTVAYYENGDVKAETSYWDNGVIKEQKKYDEQGNVTQKISAEIDGDFGLSRQVSEGDCYLMATINSIRELDNGQEMLKNLVKIETNSNGEKVYTVTFPGALVAAEGLKTDSKVDPNKMYITGTYTFTESEMEEILKQAGQRYSIGDGDVILLEAAFEKYRNEVAQTLDANPSLNQKMGLAGTQTGSDRQNILSGGFSEDPTFILTGRQSCVYSIHKDNPPFGLSYEDLRQGQISVLPTHKQTGELTKAAVSEVDGKITKDKEKLNEMLDSIMNDAKDGRTDNIAIASFQTVHANGKLGGHALTIKSVTADTVTLVNPWHPDKEVTMSREDFIRAVSHLTVADTTKPAITVDDVHNNPDSPNPHIQNPDNSVNPNNPTQPETNSYTVVRGDNLWKIAKRHLGEGATSTQIANYVNKIMKANPSLKWNRAHTHVMIHPGDNIILP